MVQGSFAVTEGCGISSCGAEPDRRYVFSQANASCRPIFLCGNHGFRFSVWVSRGMLAGTVEMTPCRLP